MLACPPARIASVRWADAARRAEGRALGAEESYGVLDVTWERAALRQHFGALRSLQPAYSGP